MAVFDFNSTPGEENKAICTYETFASDEAEATADKPIMYVHKSN